MTISRATQVLEILQGNLQDFRSIVPGFYTLIADLLLLGRREDSLSFCVSCIMQEMPGFGLILLPDESLESSWGFHGESGFCKSPSASLVSFASTHKAG